MLDCEVTVIMVAAFVNVSLIVEMKCQVSAEFLTQ